MVEIGKKKKYGVLGLERKKKVFKIMKAPFDA
jgi:hypothetical protein